jgi:hypothetical protein
MDRLDKPISTSHSRVSAATNWLQAAPDASTAQRDIAGLETLYTKAHEVSPHSARDALAALHSAYELDRQTERYPLQAVPTLPPERKFGWRGVQGNG